ncbi:MAG: TIR domain-containing protein [Muribaculaceae bacterium]|nr:TIR domain-containing protein [Muribaculaceae bacterium]
MINEYLAFISYKREDEKWAKWLQHKLEHYKLPTSVRKTNPSLPERVRPVFKDTTDLAGGVLEKAIKEALYFSKYLIVICSPRAAQSPWVCKEVQEFINFGREEFIIPFIVDGEPNSKDLNKECFPESLRTLIGEKELLGININENGRDVASIKVVARMFNIQFDTLWQRYQRELARRKRIVITGIIIFISLISLIAMLIGAQNIEIKNKKSEIEEKYRIINEQNEQIQKSKEQIQKQLDITEQQRDSLEYLASELNKKNRILKEVNDSLVKVKTANIEITANLKVAEQLNKEFQLRIKEVQAERDEANKKREKIQIERDEIEKRRLELQKQLNNQNIKFNLQ